MKVQTSTLRYTLLLALATISTQALAQNVLIRNATVHTASERGTLQSTDVLVRNGKIAAIGTALSAGDAQTIDAQGKPLTPTLFGGIGEMGIDEVSGERSTVDSSQEVGKSAGEMSIRPEFDVTLAYNPDSILIPIARTEGVGWSVLSANPTAFSSLIAGQGGVMRLDGSDLPMGSKPLFITLGSQGARFTGQSRAAQWMVLDQLIEEANGKINPDSRFALLTPAGRKTLKSYVDNKKLIVFSVDRAADIRQLLRWSKQHALNIAIIGADEAWKVAPELAQANVPVFVNGLSNLPSNFDKLAATLENAARLHNAGVKVSFIQGDQPAHYARKLRQGAGIAVANGLDWDAAFKGLTSVPAQTFGVADQIGSIAVGKRADLVLWTGDPLDIANTAAQVWLDGVAIPMQTRQTELRDRYLQPAGELPRAYSK